MKHVSLLLCLACLALASPAARGAAADELYVKVFNTILQGDQLREAGREFQQVTGLAARRRTGIQHALARSRVDEPGSQLCTSILHAQATLGETRRGPR